LPRVDFVVLDQSLATLIDAWLGKALLEQFGKTVAFVSPETVKLTVNMVLYHWSYIITGNGAL